MYSTAPADWATEHLESVPNDYINIPAFVYFFIKVHILFEFLIVVLPKYNYTHIHAEAKSTIMTNELTSFEKYTSHTLFEMVAKGLRKGYM